MSQENQDQELPQINKLLKDENPMQLIQRAAKIIDCDPEKYRQSSRISKFDKEKRDMLIYLLWETGRYTNSEISSLFGLSYSSASRRVAFIRPIVKQQKYGKFYSGLKALIEVCLCTFPRFLAYDKKSHCRCLFDGLCKALKL